MKKVISLVLCAASLFGMTACGAMGGTTSGSTTSTSNVASATNTAVTATSGSAAGRSCGAALRNLYTQYKVDGKLDMSNTANLLNIAALATSCSEIKNAVKGSDYYKTFAQGLVAGSLETVTETTAENVITSLTGIDLSGLATSSTAQKVNETVNTTTNTVNNVANSVSSAASAISSLSSLLGSFGK